MWTKTYDLVLVSKIKYVVVKPNDDVIELTSADLIFDNKDQDKAREVSGWMPTFKEKSNDALDYENGSAEHLYHANDEVAKCDDSDPFGLSDHSAHQIPQQTSVVDGLEAMIDMCLAMGYSLKGCIKDKIDVINSIEKK
ncbi:hypothetical protein LXL04_021245 [Taraxacum kok-saghyz]